MFLGKVMGYVWSTVKWPQLEGVRLVMVKPYHYQELAGVGDGPESDAVVAADVLGAGPGEDVVVAYGHAARVGIEEALPPDELPHFPIDAAVVAIVDNFYVKADETDNH